MTRDAESHSTIMREKLMMFRRTKEKHVQKRSASKSKSESNHRTQTSSISSPKKKMNGDIAMCNNSSMESVGEMMITSKTMLNKHNGDNTTNGETSLLPFADNSTTTKANGRANASASSSLNRSSPQKAESSNTTIVEKSGAGGPSWKGRLNTSTSSRVKLRPPSTTKKMKTNGTFPKKASEKKSMTSTSTSIPTSTNSTTSISVSSNNASTSPPTSATRNKYGSTREDPSNNSDKTNTKRMQQLGVQRSPFRKKMKQKQENKVLSARKKKASTPINPTSIPQRVNQKKKNSPKKLFAPSDPIHEKVQHTEKNLPKKIPSAKDVIDLCSSSEDENDDVSSHSMPLLSPKRARKTARVINDDNKNSINSKHCSNSTISTSTSAPPSTSEVMKTDVDSVETYSIDPKSATCWSCRISLDDKGSKGVESKGSKALMKGECSYYMIHSHPLLRVTCCSVCADKAYIVEDDIANIEQMKENPLLSNVNEVDSENEDEDEDGELEEITTCGWCADANRQGDNLLLCDKCPRAFCDTCISLAYGGGPKGDRAVHNLLNEECDWECIYCKPTIVIGRMQSFLDTWGEKNEDDNYTKSEKDHVDNLLIKLGALEDTVKETEAMLEVDSFEKIRRQFFEAEAASDSEIDAEKELNAWHRKWIEVHARCSDAIGFLHDELEDSGVDLRSFYSEREKVDLDSFVEAGNTEHDWKVDADEALARRDREFGKSCGASGFKNDSNIYKDIENLDDSELNEIEDICTKMEARDHIQKLADAGTNFNCDQQTVHNFIAALNSENEVFNELQTKAKRRSDAHDKELDDQLARGECTIRKKKHAPTMRIVSRSVKRLQTQTQQRKVESKRKISSIEKPEQRRNSWAKRRRIAPQQVVKASEVEFESFGGESLDFEDSGFILSTKSTDTIGCDEYVSVCTSLAKVLKPHQKDGIKFMWEQSFSDILIPSSSSHSINRGCILAHNMGLGKSIQVVALVHTVLTHPILNQEGGRRIRRILLVVPVNTLANWISEFSKWEYYPKIKVFHYNAQKSLRGKKILTEKWQAEGGVLLISYDTLSRCCKSENRSEETQKEYYVTTFQHAFINPGADAVILDEGHLQVKNNKSSISKTLSAISTPRRISLSGTPLQNNLEEYIRMVDWVRPGYLGPMATVEKKYTAPIMSSLNSDASEADRTLGDKMLRELFEKLNPFVQRLDSSVLEEDLPPMQQAVLHVRQTRAQAKLYRAFKKYQATLTSSNNFLDQYQKLFLVNNHPGCLLFQNKSSSRKRCSHINMDTESSIAPLQKSLNVSKCRDKDNIFHKKKNPESQFHSAIPNSQFKIKHEPAPNTAFKSQASIEVIIVDDDSDDDDDNDNDEAISAEINHSSRGEGVFVETNINEQAGEETMYKAIDRNEEELSSSWWSKVYSKVPTMGDIENGGKIILLLQILAHADMIGEKVVVFSQSLPTLNFIEDAIQSDDWGSKVPSISSLSPGRKWGNWQNGKDYLRIDGSIDATTRGLLINQFNDSNNDGLVEREADESTKMFLISSRAGSVGINLTAANRVVIFDSSWNPVTDLQALYRCYRYGQNKPVYAYRFITDGTMEEKVYSRCVNKTSLAARVIDQKDPKRNFTSRELSNIMAIDNWVQCDLCDKWRMLPPNADTDKLGADDFWFCGLNDYDIRTNECEKKERDVKYYNKLFWEKNDNAVSHQEKGNASERQNSNLPMPRDSIDTRTEDKSKVENTERDVVLSKLINIPAPKVKKKSNQKARDIATPLVSQYYFHDSLMADANTKAT